jgi:site-specific DNA recombinase
MPDAIRAVAYYRMSSEDQETSIEQQQAWARNTCPNEDISILEEFPDHAKKGHETATRTAFHEMLRYCQEQARIKQPIQAIVCWNPNRFSRSDSQETSWFLWEFRKVGVQRMFTASSGWIDFRKMEDRVLYNLTQDTSSHRYVQDLARDTARGRLEAAEAGRWNGGPIPYGYRMQYHEVLVGKRRKRKPDKLVICEPEAEIVRWLFRTYVDTDIGLRGLAAELNRRGVPPPKRAPRWGTGTIRRMLYNPVYLGEVVWNRRGTGKFFGVIDCRVQPVREPDKRSRLHPEDQWIRRADRHEAIIDPETFERVQRRLITNQRRTAKKSSGPFILSGLLKCGHCERHMLGRTFKTANRSGIERTYRAYLCSGYNLYGKSFCQFNSVSETALVRCLVRKLAAKLEADFLDPSNVEKFKDEIRRQATAAQQNTDPALETNLRTRLEALDVEISRAARRMLTVEDEALVPSLQRELKGLHEQQAQLTLKLALGSDKPARKAQDIDEIVALAGAYVGRLQEALSAASPGKLAMVIREMVSQVEMWFDHQPKGKGRTRCRFAEGLIYLREDVSLSSDLITTLGHTDLKSATSSGNNDE